MLKPKIRLPTLEKSGTVVNYYLIIYSQLTPL